MRPTRRTRPQFVNFYLNPSLAAVLNLRFGTTFPTRGARTWWPRSLQYNGDGTCGEERPLRGAPPAGPRRRADGAHRPEAARRAGG